MSVVTVQLGQCGNQIGTELFSTLHSDASSANPSSPYRQVALERFFHTPEEERSRDLTARAVLVDMESKVVHRSLASAKKGGAWSFDERCVHTEKKGSGNNWANGYISHASSSRSVASDMVRRQVERCDHLDGFLILMSVAGGTGSGVGARLTEHLRDDYPGSTLTNPIIWPYPSGEVIVQDYNSVLTTAHLQANTDAIILLQNQQLHKVCSQLLHLKEITFSDINRVLAHSLASMLQPAVPFDAHPHHEDMSLYGRCRLSDLVRGLSPHPQYKILSLRSIPQIPKASHDYSRFLWAGLLKHLRQMLITDSPTEEGMDWGVAVPVAQATGAGLDFRGDINISLANLLILRGNELCSVDKTMLSAPPLYSNHTPFSCTCSVWSSTHPFNHYEKCCTLVSNSQSCVAPLERVCRKAWNMFSSKAYLHQYQQHGFSHEDFLNCFVAVEQILKNYKSIIK